MFAVVSSLTLPSLKCWPPVTFDLLRSVSRRNLVSEFRITRRSMIAQSAAGALTLAACKRVPKGESAAQGNGKRRIGLIYFAPEEGADTCMKGIWDGLK